MTTSKTAKTPSIKKPRAKKPLKITAECGTSDGNQITIVEYGETPVVDTLEEPETAPEIPKAAVNVPNVVKDIQEKIQESVAHELRNIPGTIRETMSEAIYNLLGITKRYGRYELDRNSRSDASIREFVRNTLFEACTDYIKPLIVQEVRKLANNKAFKEKLVKMVASNYAYHYESVMRDVASSISKKFAENISKTITEHVDAKVKEATTVDLDFMSPTVLSGFIGQVLMDQELAKFVDVQ